MKKLKIPITIVILNIIAALTAPALTTTNLLAPVFIQTTYTNGQPVAYYTFQLPLPQIVVVSYSGITNTAAGTNALGFGATATLYPTNLWNIYPTQTNASSDTYTANQIPGTTNGFVNVTVAVFGTCTNATATGTNFVQQQWMHQ